MARKKHSKSIATIGYEGAGFSDFVRTLKQAGISHVLDIRDLPLSRRAGFSKTSLSSGLSAEGIAYTHLKGLGTPKEGRLAVRSGRMKEFREIFAAHMKTETARSALSLAAKIVEQEPCCLLCFEADPEHCHRLVVAKALHQRSGLNVEHLHVIPI